MYSCGPTVYSHPHIGNFRSFIAADILRRYLEYQGYEVKQVMNITDVGHMTTDDAVGGGAGEDKIQAAARREKKTPWEIARFYEQEFLELSRLLNLKPAFVYPRATEHIPEMIDLIKKLIERNFAYEVNGNVYYDIVKFKNYGQLSGNTLANLMAGARIEVNLDKHNPLDFALWKQDQKHLMQWDSPWPIPGGQGKGKGFPGWHIECSAMSMKYLGNDIDIHTGGEDNIFPHHESEIAQSEAAHGKKFVHYWFHVRHLLVNNQKMSKSLGNFYTVRDIVARGYHPLVLRYALSNTHYRQPLNFTLESLKSASHALQRLRDFKQMLSEKKKERVESSQKKIGCLIEKSVLKLIDTTKQNFETALDDDLNISEALAAIFDLVREINKLDLNPGEAEATYQLINKLDSIIGVLGVSETGEVSETENIPENVLYVLKSGDLSKEVENLIGERNQARQDRDYQRADQIRQQLKEIGVVLEDTPQGVRWKKIL